MYRRFFLILTCFCVLTSCSSLTRSLDGQTKTSDISGTASQSTDPELVNTYYDFDDILIPSDLKLDRKESIVFESSTIKAGTLQFHGRIEPVSLFNFFTHHLPQDNWAVTSHLKYGHFLIVAEKKSKFCILTIEESSWSTYLRIWVTPRIP